MLPDAELSRHEESRGELRPNFCSSLAIEVIRLDLCGTLVPWDEFRWLSIWLVHQEIVLHPTFCQ